MDVSTVRDDDFEDEFIVDEYEPSICCGQVSSGPICGLRGDPLSQCKIITGALTSSDNRECFDEVL